VNNKAIIRALLILFALFLSASAQPQTVTGKVVGVSDGDTITILDSQRRQHKISLDGVDAPESNQDFGSRAKQSLSGLVFGKTVTVTSAKRDRYGRIVGQVLCDGKSANIEQLRRGYAWFYRAYAKELKPGIAEAFELAENYAKSGKRGLWADPSPVPPWDFRRGKTAKAPVAPPPTTATGPIIGARNSKIYHLPNCPDYSKLSEKNRAPFKSEAEAQAAGYRKAKNCPQ
jgi:endonuclease YncB( thermonuclease family)